MNLTLILLCICGLLMHFLGRWGEHVKTKGRTNPLKYLGQDVPGWLSAIIGAVVCMVLLPDLPAVLGIVAPDIENSGLMKLLALTAGYMGSSLAAKVPALVTGRGTR